MQTDERWRKSSHSNNDGGVCIEVDDAHPGTVRDSKDPDGPRLVFPADVFAAFVAGVKAGDFGTV
ncbi:hypothetical protein P3T36_000823 [Kitasatospora sp. MAP12-15]|uniref:DUF397 domain-containing protein n=1 Tax=unclassified Kitasatospora TaxID=2633591 RepID=UPI002473F6BC|nr:DUF397 domain-containing protein [Kitasatospora sp. MAP12-44]MDH6114422.1 hypothetical protein [Kitasatospora sp. MAP12-44]